MKEFAMMLVLGLANAAWAQPAVTPTTPAQPEKKAAVSIEKMAVGNAVQNRELLGEATTFDASVGRLYCWTKVKAETTPANIKHVWYLDGKKAAEVSLAIAHPKMRTWSSKSIKAGAWKVEAQAEDGTVLQTVEFTVTKAAGEPAKAEQPKTEKKPEAPKTEKK